MLCNYVISQFPSQVYTNLAYSENYGFFFIYYYYLFINKYIYTHISIYIYIYIYVLLSPFSVALLVCI